MGRCRIIIVIGLLAVIAATMHLLPECLSYVLAPSGKNNNLRLLFLLGADDEHYLVQLYTAYTGKFQPGNRYIYEHRIADGYLIRKFVLNGINALGILGKISGLSFPVFINLSRFLLPLVAFILLYFIFNSLGTLSKIHSGIFSLLTLITPYLVYCHLHFFSRLILELLLPLKPGWNEQLLNSYLPWSRLVNPQFSGLFFLLTLWCLINFVKKSSGWRYLLLSLPVLYLSYKFYFYFWTALGVFLVLLFLLAMGFKRRGIWVPLLIAFVGGFWVLRSELTAMFRLFADKDAALFTYAQSRLPVVSPAVMGSVFLLILFWFWRHKFRSEEAILLFACLLTPVVCMNQQIITGKIVQAWHYELFVNPVFLWLAIFIFWQGLKPLQFIEEKVSSFLTRSGGIRKVLQVFVAIVALVGIILYFNLHLSWSGKFTAKVGVSLFFYCLLWLIFCGGIGMTLELLAQGRFNYWRKFAMGFLLVLAIGDATERQVYVMLRRLPSYRWQQQFAGAFTWLKEKAPTDSVVLAPMEIAEILPAYTNKFVYISKNAVHYKLAQSEREQRLAAYFFIMGANLFEVQELIHHWPYRYILWGLRYFSPVSYDLYSFGQHKLIPPAEKTKFLELFTKIKAEPQKSLPDFRLNYILQSQAWLKDHSVPESIRNRLTIQYVDKFAVIYSLPANIFN